jgi:hypothetical protein
MDANDTNVGDSLMSILGFGASSRVISVLETSLSWLMVSLALYTIGKYGSLAVIERFIKSLKNECVRLLPVVPLAQAAFNRELDHYVAWYNAERPHTRLAGATPDEIYFNKRPACRRPRFEPRARWPRRSRCAGAQTLVRGQPGAVLELSVTYRDGRKHLPVVSLRRVA